MLFTSVSDPGLDFVSGLDSGVGPDSGIGLEVASVVGSEVGLGSDVGSDIGSDVGSDVGLDMGLDLGLGVGLGLASGLALVCRDSGIDMGIDKLSELSVSSSPSSLLSYTEGSELIIRFATIIRNMNELMDPLTVVLLPTTVVLLPTFWHCPNTSKRGNSILLTVQQTFLY